MTTRPSTGKLAAAIVLLGAAIAWRGRFLLDDAFISFRYARHLAEGHGLVWNVGEAPIEGFTNFLWTVLLGGLARVGIDPAAAAPLIGVLCFAGTLAVTFVLARRWTEDARTALAATLLVAVNPTASAFATSGLETSAFTLAFTASVLLAASATIKRRAAAGAVAGMAVALRPDGAVLLAVVLASIAMRARREGARSTAAMGPAIAAAALVIVPTVAARYATFHALVPNTYLAKVAGDAGWGRGLAYLLAFGVLHAALPLGALAVGSALRARDLEAAPGLALVAAWSLYVCWVGGDFMELRFMAPIIPVGTVLAARAVEREVASITARAAVAIGLAGALLVTWSLTRGELYFTPALKIETVRALGRHVDHPDEDWRGIGRRLGEAFRREDGVTLAVTAAGAIPYESRLRSVDAYGLNDRGVALQGKLVETQASGHRRVATLPYLVERGAHLLVCTSTIWTRGEPRTAYPIGEVRRTFLEAIGGRIPEGARVVEIPLDEQRAFRVLYLQPHPAIEARLGDPGWRVFPINRPAAP